MGGQLNLFCGLMVDYSGSSLPFPFGAMVLGYGRPRLLLVGLSVAVCSISRSLIVYEHVLLEGRIVFKN